MTSEIKEKPNTLPEIILALETMAKTLADRLDLDSLDYFIQCLNNEVLNRRGWVKQ